MKTRIVLTVLIAGLAIVVIAQAFRWRSDNAYRYPSTEITQYEIGDVVFSGGFDTEEQDHGRPVRLIAAALGVESQVFRDAFSGVTPARGMFGPTPSAARDNKKVLMDALGPYGITNERLDEVSNQYRYPPGPGYLWKHVPARATAIVTDGKVTGFTLIDAGSGYLTEPEVSVAGYEDVKVKTMLRFSQDFTTNGSIESLTIE